MKAQKEINVQERDKFWSKSEVIYEFFMASFSLLLSKGQRNLTILKFMLKNTSAFFNVE